MNGKTSPKPVNFKRTKNATLVFCAGVVVVTFVSVQLAINNDAFLDILVEMFGPVLEGYIHFPEREII